MTYKTIFFRIKIWNFTTLLRPAPCVIDLKTCYSWIQIFLALLESVYKSGGVTGTLTVYGFLISEIRYILVHNDDYVLILNKRSSATAYTRPTREDNRTA